MLRLLVAAAGVAFIAWSLTWHDSVVLPIGWTSPGGVALTEPMVARVIEADLDRTGRPKGSLRLALPEDSGMPAELTLAAWELEADDATPQFRPGIVTTLRSADFRLLAIGVVLVGLMFPIQAMRWLMLLRCRGLTVSYRKALRLTMVGQFFNFCMPGMTGGDVAKAYYAAKRSENRGAAVMSVIFDRLAGLVGLILLAGLVGLTLVSHPLILRITVVVWVGLTMIVVFSALYFSRRFRRWFRIEQFGAKLPGHQLLGKIDAAALAYRDHKMVVALAMLLSLPAHLMCSAATALAGYALGMEQPWAVLMTVIPVLLLAGSVPLTYQGLGVMEGIAMAMLLDPPLATANQIVGMLLMLRLYLIVWALAGSLALLRGDIHMFPEVEEEVA